MTTRKPYQTQADASAETIASMAERYLIGSYIESQHAVGKQHVSLSEIDMVREGIRLGLNFRGV